MQYSKSKGLHSRYILRVSGFSLTLLIPLVFLLAVPCFSENTEIGEPEYAGEFFGMPVSKENYYFAARVVLSFNTPWGGIPDNTSDFEKRVWDELLLSYEAFRRGIEPLEKEVEQEIIDTIKAGNGPSNRKEDKKAYAKWIKKTLGGPVILFEHQMRHLVQLKKLRQQVLDSINLEVTEKEAFQEFLNEYNTLSVELAQFESLDNAKKSYEKAKNDPEFWDKEVIEDAKKDKKDTIFRRPGFVSLEFLIDVWKFPKEDVYKMIDMEIGSFYHPVPIYKGYGVFKILEVRKADKTAFPDQKESYFGQLKSKKKYEGFYKWLGDLRERANLRIYLKPPEGLFKQVEG